MTQSGHSNVPWRAQVRESREFIATETASNLASAMVRIVTTKCVESRLDSLAAILDDAAANGGRLPPVGYIGNTSRRVWRHAVWESVVASQAAAHFSRQELANLADVYNLVQRGEAISGAELDAWSDLSTMVGPGRRLDPASEAELRRALSRARTYNRTLTAISSILMAQARGLKLPFSTSDLGLIDANRRTSLSQDAATPSNPYPMNLCGPIGAAAAHYGQSTLGTLPKFLDGSGKQLEGYTASLKQASP